MYDGTAKAEAELGLVKDMLKNYQPPSKIQAKMSVR
jgi:hypothetical protein